MQPGFEKLEESGILPTGADPRDFAPTRSGRLYSPPVYGPMWSPIEQMSTQGAQVGLGAQVFLDLVVVPAFTIAFDR